LVLESSLKPFTDPSPRGIRSTCERIWAVWRPLIERVDELAVLLWVGNGDEIFTWTGDGDQPLPWANQIGFCNYPRPGAYDPKNRHYRLNRAVPYAARPPALRFRDLRDIVKALRRTARQAFRRAIEVGATVDPGPEFVDSPFRYETHRELLVRRRPWMTRSMHFITHQATVHGDGRAYAAFPKGLDEDVPLGRFLGLQFDALRRYVGFDYLWFSNGFGYSHHPWGWRGELMDGTDFHPGRAAGQRRRLVAFWRDFRQACPDTGVEVRGTNFSVAMDLASDGCSHEDVASIAGLVRPPCNPPWGSRSLGLELVSYLSRLATLPDGRIPLRFYLNDPWFVSRPWFDYYGREPFDIYVPGAASRLNEEGSVDTPTDLTLLTIDSCAGALDDRQALEVIPHLLEAGREQADAPGPVIWVYPAREYEQTLREAPEELHHLFAHDWFMSRAVDAGLPLGTVCPSQTFLRLQRQGQLPDAVYVAPAPIGQTEYSEALARHVRSGGSVMLYGSLERSAASLLRMLRIRLGEPVEGDCLLVRNHLQADRFAVGPQAPLEDDPVLAVIGMASGRPGRDARASRRPLRHRALVSGGGLREIVEEGDAGARVVVGRGRHRRVCAVVRQSRGWRGGRLLWLRGTVSFDPGRNTLEPAWDPAHSCLQPAEWARSLLAETGLRIVQERHDPATRPTYLFIKRTGGAWVFVGHKPDTSVRFFVRTPHGAPAYEEQETPLVGGYAGESFGKTFCRPVRAFVDQMPDGVVTVKRLPPPLGRRAHFSITGLRRATVTLYPDPEALAEGAVRVQPKLRAGRVPYEIDRRQGTVRVRHITGALYISW
jgi:hypothetical protein